MSNGVVIFKKDVPENRPCHIWTENQLNLIGMMKSLKPKYTGEHFLKMKIDWDMDAVLSRILKATEKHKWWGWINKNARTAYSENDKMRLPYEGRDHLNRGSYYGGWSIKSNPTYCKQTGITPEAAGMGEMPSPLSWLLFSNIGYDYYVALEESNKLLPLTRTAVERGYKAMINELRSYSIIPNDRIDAIILPEDDLELSKHKEKDSYFDTWSYTDFTPASVESGIKDLLSNSRCQVLRSRVAYQRGMFRNYRTSSSSNDRYTWHSDEPIVHNLRLNIPISKTSNFGIQHKDKDPVPFERGYAMTWDTNRVHRQIQLNDTPSDRINIVVGFNPWFSWDDEQQAWVSNEFFGKIHPLDMMVEGLVLPSLKFDSEIIQ